MVQNKKAKLGVIAGALLVASTTLFPAQAANSGTLIISVNQSFTSPVGTAVVSGASEGKRDFSNKLPPVASYFTILAAGTVSY